MTFSLTGFSTVKREGVVLSGNFDAPVNAELRVGSLEETITVSGASPVVDVTNTLTQTVLTKEQIEVLPGGRTIQGRAALVPGVMVTSANTGVIAHGSASTDSHTMIDGYKSGMHLVGRGTGRLGVGSVTQTQEATIEELVYDASGQGAEYAFSGVRMNMIPKEGGNRTRGRSHRLRQPRDLRVEQPRGLAGASVQLPVRAAGVLLRLQPGRRRADQARTSCGTSARSAGNREQHADPRHLLQAGRALDAGEVSGPAVDDQPVVPGRHRREVELSETIRVTHQATNKHKLRYSFDNTRVDNLRGNYTTLGCEAFAGGGVASAALPDLVRAGAVDGADHEPPAARGRLCRISAATSA